MVTGAGPGKAAREPGYLAQTLKKAVAKTVENRALVLYE